MDGFLDARDDANSSAVMLELELGTGRLIACRRTTALTSAERIGLLWNERVCKDYASHNETLCVGSDSLAAGCSGGVGAQGPLLSH